VRRGELGSLRRTSPLSDVWGRDRGTPIDRYYIEKFLEEHRGDVTGHVVELLDDGYTRRFGVGVSERDVLDIDPANDAATIVADLTAADGVATETFDCFLLVQTLHFIYDVRAAVAHAHRTLKPGGVLLCTEPAVSRISARSLDSEYWRFTAASCKRMFGDVFGPGQVEVRSYGNVLAAIGFLTGLAYEELSGPELDEHDPFFPVIVAVRAQKRPVDEGGSTPLSGPSS
jgi:SAM-dependent methyltransferase